MTKRFLDLHIADGEEKQRLSQAFESHLCSGEFIEGESLKNFEKNFSAIHEKKYCIGVKTGTDALVLALRAMKLPLESKVLTTPFSWIASSTAILLAGLHPIFCGIGDDLNMDPKSFPNPCPENVSAILVVHLHGIVCNMDEIIDYANRYNLKIIEDCAQAYFSADDKNILAGTRGDISCFSFNPMKMLPALGDGGAILTNDEDIMLDLKELRHSGISSEGSSARFLTNNCRLDSLQASFLDIRLDYVGQKIERRAYLVNEYKKRLSNQVKILAPNTHCRQNHYVLQTFAKHRDELKNFLLENKIESRVRHNFLIYDHPIFQEYRPSSLIDRGFLNEILCLPLHEHLSLDDVDYICEKISEFYEKNKYSKN
jgi:dTDP-4-amino-4,6-dideoxygalactose transaminase